MTLSVLLDSGSVAFSLSGVSQTKLMAAGLDLSCQEVSNIVFLGCGFSVACIIPKLAD